jgi:integrase
MGNRGGRMGLELSVKEFLDSLPSRGTRKVYKYGLNKFLEWYGKTGKEVLEERKDDLTQRPNEDIVTYRNRAAKYERIIESFYNHLMEKGYKINAAKSITHGIRQLFRFYHMDVRMRSGSNVNRTVKTQKSFPLTIEHVRRMYVVADFRERVILSMATDLGLRIGDFLEIKKLDLPDLSLEAPVAFDVMTDKEDVIAKGFLSQETVDLLKKYVDTLSDDNPFLFPSNQKKNKPISKSQMGNLLRDLAEKAEIKVTNGKSLSFHCFRKMFLSAAIDSGVGLTVGKILCGKTVDSSDITYLTTVKLKQHFIQLKKFLMIDVQPGVEEEKVDLLKKAVSRLQEDLNTQKIISETLSEENQKLQYELKRLKKSQLTLEEKVDTMTSLFRTTFNDSTKTSQ